MKNILNYLEYLPQDMVNIIYTFIPISTRIYLSKKEFDNNYLDFVKNIGKRRNSLNTYITFLIKKKCSLQFEINLKNNYKRWCKIKKFQYKIDDSRFRFPTYICYLKYKCSEYESNLCKLAILNYEKEKEIKIYKNKKIRNIRWKN